MTYTTKQQYLDKVAELRVELLAVKSTDLRMISRLIYEGFVIYLRDIGTDILNIGTDVRAFSQIDKNLVLQIRHLAIFLSYLISSYIL